MNLSIKLSKKLVTKYMDVNDFKKLINFAFMELGVKLQVKWVAENEKRADVFYNASLIDCFTVNDNRHFVEGNAYGDEIYNPFPGSTIKVTKRIIYFSIQSY